MNNPSDSGRTLYIQRWLPEKPRALIFLLHGIFEHGGRYREFAGYLNETGIGLVAADHYGHGQSPGKKGFIAHWDELIEDASHWIGKIRSEYPELPCFLMGQSLGGLLAVSYLRKKKPAFRAVVLLSPALIVSRDLSPVLQKLAPLLNAVVPHLKTVRLDATAVSRDPKVVSDYVNDPLNYTGKVYVRTGHETLQATKSIRAYFPEFNWPVLILHGTADRLTEPDGSQLFYDQISSEDKTLRLFEGWYHELLNEPEKEQIFEMVRDWITSRM